MAACIAATAGIGVDCRDLSWSLLRRSSGVWLKGCGECLGDRPRGDLVRWVPKVAPLLWFSELWPIEAGESGLFGALNGPEWVGVMALVEAAMRGRSGRLWCWERV